MHVGQPITGTGRKGSGWQMNEQNLKPCPFCGGRAKLEDYGLNGNFVVVHCLDCGAMTRLFAKGIRLGETAFEAWNRRTADER